ncbi:LysR substrate-binding domain-containing protein [Paraburkholderia sp. A2WS-5]|uniref:LysR substrate-binding domain-containing protein n=1 Tax=unclassified Paraburkholderia TaxID=2615204 RepID=UPI003B7EFB28
MKSDSGGHRPLFDLDLLKAIVMVADCGTFTAASARLHSTQSTVSQKVKRLEDMAGHKLLERGARDVRPTDAGETLLAYARRMLALNDEMLESLAGATVGLTVRLGVPEDFVGGPTTHMLAAFTREHPLVKLEVTSGLSRDVERNYDRGDLDLALVKHRRNSREAVASWPEQLRWIDSAKNPSFQLDPIPLVAFPPRGLYRDDMTNAIEGLGRRWRMSFISSSLSGIQAAVADGLGISLLPLRSVTADHVVLTQKSGLPAIETMDLALLHRPTADTVVKELARAMSRMIGKPRR